MKIENEFQRFVDSYEHNYSLSLRAELPLARWAYGACKEWIKDFKNIASETGTQSQHSASIAVRENALYRLLRDLKLRFPKDKLIGDLE